MTRIKKKILFILIIFLFTLNNSYAVTSIANDVAFLKITNNNQGLFFYQLKNSKLKYFISAPEVEIDGIKIKALLKNIQIQQPVILSNRVKEYTVTGQIEGRESMSLLIRFRLSPDNTIIRFQYELLSDKDCHLTKQAGKDGISYLSIGLNKASSFTEVRFADYNDKYHSYILNEVPIRASSFENELAVMGPMLVSETLNVNESFFVAYEHGSQYPDAFLNFKLQKNYRISLDAVRGNYSHQQLINKNNSYKSIWFEIGAVNGNKEAVANHYRTFALQYLSENTESRKPYLFYNTWGRQERVAWGGGKYLASMNLAYTLKEIDRAKEMGIDVFVIDVGWFLKTGDWQVNTNPNFFPDTLQQVIKKIKAKGMKLGLWFNPVVAARTSNMLNRNLDAVSTWDGKDKGLTPIWETEESRQLCLVSKYWEDYSNEMLRIIKELNISYVKWDAVDQYGCNNAHHLHGTEQNSIKERTDSYAFQLPIYLSKVVEKVNQKYPEVIFDFDITENGRAVGLGFLSSGKYFAINNGPYYHNFDLAEIWGSPLPNKNANILIQPGPARPWFMRSILTYDKWLPSTLFLTHYQTDGSPVSQRINIASLILGQNGIWGEILKVSDTDVNEIAKQISAYKLLRDDITLAQPVTQGSPGDFFEIHEKINTNGKGVVVIFGIGKGEFTYVTKNKVALPFNTDLSRIKIDNKGRAVITIKFDQADAAVFYFGAKTY